MKFYDLQVHTTASDGKLSSKEIVDLAIKRGMKAIAITDHDTIEGAEEAINYSEGKDIEIIAGIEVGCKEPGFDSPIDVIGLFIDYKDEKLNSFIREIKSARMREERNIIRRINNPIFKKISESDRKLIKTLKKMFVPRKKSSLMEAVDIIKSSGGIPVLAHPARYGNEMINIINRFSSAGGKGIEADYPYNKVIGISNKINEKIRKIAGKKRLLISGGSDFHYFNHGGDIGECGVSDEEFEKLKKSLK